MGGLRFSSHPIVRQVTSKKVYFNNHLPNTYSIRIPKSFYFSEGEKYKLSHVRIGPWLLASSQRARPLLGWSKFESHWYQQFFCKIYVCKEQKLTKEVWPIFYKNSHVLLRFSSSKLYYMVKAIKNWLSLTDLAFLTHCYRRGCSTCVISRTWYIAPTRIRYGYFVFLKVA